MGGNPVPFPSNHPRHTFLRLSQTVFFVRNQGMTPFSSTITNSSPSCIYFTSYTGLESILFSPSLQFEWPSTYTFTNTSDCYAAPKYYGKNRILSVLFFLCPQLKFPSNSSLIRSTSCPHLCFHLQYVYLSAISPSHSDKSNFCSL